MGGIVSPVTATEWALLLSKTGGKVPKDAGQILDLRLLLEPELGKDDACLIATYIGTGRSDANTSWTETGTQTAEDACGCGGWFGGRSVADAMAAMHAHFDATLPSLSATLQSWSEQKAVTAKASVSANVKQDVDKIKHDAAVAAAGVGVAVGGGVVVYLFGGAILLWMLSRGAKG